MSGRRATADAAIIPRRASTAERMPIEVTARGLANVVITPRIKGMRATVAMLALEWKFH